MKNSEPAEGDTSVDSSSSSSFAAYFSERAAESSACRSAVRPEFDRNVSWMLFRFVLKSVPVVTSSPMPPRASEAVALNSLASMSPLYR